MTERVHVVISGFVQGVGFRYFVHARASALGLGGWVRNDRDGTVEVEAEGESEKLDTFLEAIRVGPRSARVTDVRLERTEIPRQSHSFEVR